MSLIWVNDFHEDFIVKMKFCVFFAAVTAKTVSLKGFNAETGLSDRPAMYVNV